MSSITCRRCGKTFDGWRGTIYCPDCRTEVKRENGKKLNDRVCRLCGVTFKGGPRAYYCPQCKADIKREYDAKRYSATHNIAKRPLGSIDKCQVCGKEYVVVGPNCKYCPDCAPKVVKEIDRRQGLDWYRDNKDTANPQRKAARKSTKIKYCTICGKQIPPGTSWTICDDPACYKERLRQERKKADAKRRPRKTKPKETTEN